MSEAKNIALVSAAGDVVPDVKDRFALEEISGAARLGFAFALAEDLSPTGALDGPREHNFAVKTVDPENTFPTLLRIFYPERELEEADPYRIVELLMNKGLIRLGSQVELGEIAGISDLLDHCESDT